MNTASGSGTLWCACCAANAVADTAEKNLEKAAVAKGIVVDWMGRWTLSRESQAGMRGQSLLPLSRSMSATCAAASTAPNVNRPPTALMHVCRAPAFASSSVPRF